MDRNLERVLTPIRTDTNAAPATHTRRIKHPHEGPRPYVPMWAARGLLAVSSVSVDEGGGQCRCGCEAESDDEDCGCVGAAVTCGFC